MVTGRWGNTSNKEGTWKTVVASTFETPMQILHCCHHAVSRVLFYKLLLLSGLARRVALLVNLCPRLGYLTLSLPDLAREVVVPCDHMITLLHTPVSKVLHFLYCIFIILLSNNTVSTICMDVLSTAREKMAAPIRSKMYAKSAK